MIKIFLTQKEFIKNPATKKTYILKEEIKEEITPKIYNNLTKEDTLKHFRRLGGSEKAQYSYTCNGYKITKLTSTAPDKSVKIIRNFEFTYIEN